MEIPKTKILRLHQQVVRALALRIMQTRGEENNNTLPTETELADEFGCGPDTAARALRALQREGLARRVLRRGYESSDRMLIQASHDAPSRRRPHATSAPPLFVSPACLRTRGSRRIISRT